jgi:hypothetical protein
LSKFNRSSGVDHGEQLNQSILESEVTMNDRYIDYLAETRRRQEQIKFADMYRMAKSDPDSPPAPKAYQRLFRALGARMVRWGNRLQERQPAPQQDYAHERS